MGRKYYDKLSIQLSPHLLQPTIYKENKNVLLLVLETKLNQCQHEGVV